MVNVRPEPAEDRALNLTRLLEAPRSLVFAAWTQPQHLVRWWGPSNFTLPVCEQDLRVGGAYKFCMRAPDGSEHWVWGVYREIVEPERLSFTWNRTQSPATENPWARTIVTVTLTEEARGQTRLTLHQATFPKDTECEDHRGGWTQCLDRLGGYVTQGAGRAALTAEFFRNHNPRPIHEFARPGRPDL